MQIIFREVGQVQGRTYDVNPLDLVRIATDYAMVEVTATVQDSLKVREPGTNLVAVFNGRDALGVSGPDTTPGAAPYPGHIEPSPTFLAIEAIRDANRDESRDVELGWDAVLKAVENARDTADTEKQVEKIILGHFNQEDGQWRLNPRAAAREVLAYLNGAPL